MHSAAVNMRLVLASGLFLAIVWATLASAEIHRARQALKTKTGRSLNRDPASKYQKNSLFNSTEVLFLGHTTETWGLSMVSAALVGLSGIFPLAVIPLEAGKALRKGGQYVLETLKVYSPQVLPW